MKIGEDSPLQFPITLLRFLPYVNKYYDGKSRHLDAYEHYWVGAVFTYLFSFGMFFSKWFVVGIPVTAFFHIIWKEVWHDRVKRTTPKEWEAFWVDLTLRTAGYVTNSWMPTLAWFYG